MDPVLRGQIRIDGAPLQAAGEKPFQRDDTLVARQLKPGVHAQEAKAVL